jgi:hypothetical protein
MILARCTRRAANCLKDLSHIASNMQQDVLHLPLGYQHLLAIQEERRGFAMTFSKDAKCTQLWSEPIGVLQRCLSSSLSDKLHLFHIWNRCAVNHYPVPLLEKHPPGGHLARNPWE